MSVERASLPQPARGWRRMMLLAVVIVVGSLIAIQPALNAQMGRTVGTVSASVVSFVVGLSVLMIVAAIAGQIGGLANVGEARWPYFLGGLIGAAVVLVSLIAVPRLGAGPMSAGLVFGQMVMAVIVDRQGWFGVPQTSLTPTRILGVLMVLGGVLLVNQRD